MGQRKERKGPPRGQISAAAPNRDIVESRTIAGILRGPLFERLADIERFPEWGYGLRRAILLPASGTSSVPGGLHPESRAEFGLRAAGIEHHVTSLVTEIDPPRLIKWRYLSGASWCGGWLLEEAEESVRTTLSTDSPDYSVEPPWLDRIARKPFFQNLISDLLSRSLGRLQDDLETEL